MSRTATGVARRAGPLPAVAIGTFALAALALVALAPAVWSATAPASATPAAATATAAPAPSVDDIVARYIDARGGLRKIRAIKTLREHGRLTTGANREAVVTRELKRPNRTRLEITVQGVTAVYISDGRQGWKMSPFDGDTEPNPLPEEAVQEAAEQADIEGPLVDWKAKGHQVELAGHEVVGGRDTYKLKMTLKSGAVRYEYIDAGTWRRLRTDSTRTVRGHAVRIETTFGEYKKAGGVFFPRLVEVVAVGRPQRLRVVVDSVEINPSLDDARFER